MKIKKLVCIGSINNLRERPSTIFGSKKEDETYIIHKIEFHKEFHGFMVDDSLLIPMHRVMEVIFEEEKVEPKKAVK